MKRPIFSRQDFIDLGHHVSHMEADAFTMPKRNQEINVQSFRRRSHAGKSLLEEQGILLDISHLRYKRRYIENPDHLDTELFAKLATFLTLRRYRHGSSVDYEDVRRTELELCGTAAGKAVIEAVDTLESDYKQVSHKQRERAERFARNAAKTLESSLPHSTHYKRPAPNIAHSGR